MIADKVPQVIRLEKKLGMLEGLDPVLEGILTDLYKVTDFSRIHSLKKYQDYKDHEFSGPSCPEDESKEDSATFGYMVNNAAASAVKAIEETENPDDVIKQLKKVKKSITGTEEGDESQQPPKSKYAKQLDIKYSKENDEIL